MSLGRNGWSVKRVADKAFRPGERTALTYVLRVGRQGLQHGGCIFMTGFPSPWGTEDAALFATRNQLDAPRHPNHLAAASCSGRRVPVGHDKGWFLFKNVGQPIPAGAMVKILLGRAPKGGRGRLILSLHPRYEKLFEPFVVDPAGDGKRLTLRIPTVNIVPDEREERERRVASR